MLIIIHILLIFCNFCLISLCNPIIISSNLDYGLNYRLDGLTIPLSYDVTLKTYIHLNEHKFDGNVKIYLKPRQLTKSIQLNAYPSLIIHDVKLQQTRESCETVLDSVAISTVVLTADTEMLHITTKDELELEKVYVLDIEYTGYLLNGTKGFYYSSYFKPSANQSMSLASTQMQATYARSAFPCYDEPEYKATFDIHIVHHNSRNAISNMPEKNATNEGDFIKTTFETTPLMSTYLLAFVISDFEYNAQDDGFIKVFSRPDHIQHTEYALETSILTLDIIQTYFNLTYDLPKLYLIAMPRFQSGAMENWGLIKFRSDFLLYEIGISTLWDQENIAATIAHEFAHNFFGNLVTPKWWSSLWLSESFATFYEYYIAHLVNKKFRMDELFVVEKLQAVFWRDAFASTFPMYRDGESPSEINAIFNGITYTKGASVIRMMNYAIGEDIFLEALNAYVLENKYGNVVSSDLYRSIQNRIGEDNLNVEQIFDSWVTQPGYPVISVNRNYATNSMTVTQKRFYMDPDESNDDATRYCIPYNFVTSSLLNFQNTTPMGWIKQSETIISISEAQANRVPANEWIIFNAKQTGYYRVNYDDNNWNLITDHLNSYKFRDIIPLNRAQLIDDSINLGRAGQLGYEVVFSLLEYLAREDDYIPWVAANANFIPLFRMTRSNSDLNSSFQRFGRYIITNAFKKFGIDDLTNEPRIHKKLRLIVINLACRFHLNECLVAAFFKLEQFEKNYLKLKDVPVEYAKEVLCAVMRNITDKSFKNLQTRFNNLNDAVERDILLQGFGCTENSEQITSIIGTLFYNDIPDGMTYLAGEQLQIARTLMKNGGAASANMILNYLSKNFNELKSINYDRLSQIVLDLDLYINTDVEFSVYNELLLKIGDNESKSDIVESHQNAERNVLWLLKYSKRILHLLDKEYPEIPLDRDENDEGGKGGGSASISIYLSLTILSLLSSFENIFKI